MGATIKSTSDDINKKQIKGIDLVVKALSKSYPFIKGWDFHKKTYSSLIFLSLTIDIKELTEYVKGTLDPYWAERLKEKPEIVYSLGAIISNVPIENDVRKLRDNIENKAVKLYQSLPDELAIYNEMESDILHTKYPFRPNISILNYKQIYQ